MHANHVEAVKENVTALYQFAPPVFGKIHKLFCPNRSGSEINGANSMGRLCGYDENEQSSAYSIIPELHDPSSSRTSVCPCSLLVFVEPRPC